jgi:anti-sigma28 factor (negative regulator of flagellin synthesis)
MGVRLGMSMIPPDVAGVSGPGRAGAGTVGASPETSTAPTDDILISAAISALSQISASDTAKLASVAAAVQNGSYQVDPAATSHAIVEEALLWGSLA